MVTQLVLISRRHQILCLMYQVAGALVRHNTGAGFIFAHGGTLLVAERLMDGALNAFDTHDKGFVAHLRSSDFSYSFDAWDCMRVYNCGISLCTVLQGSILQGRSKQ